MATGVKIAFLLLGLLLVGGLVGREAWNYDPKAYPYSKDQVQAMLVDAKTTLPRRDGDGKIQIWSAGRSAKGVKLNMKYASSAPLLECEAVVTAINPKESRVVADCGKRPGSDDSSAMSRTQDALRSPMFEEHIVATLKKRPFNRDNVTAKETAAVFKNLNGMQQEALQMSADTARQIAEERRR
jgi:hypothetical protein